MLREIDPAIYRDLRHWNVGFLSQMALRFRKELLPDDPIVLCHKTDLLAIQG